MKTEILARVADLIRNPEAPMRLDRAEEGQETSAFAVVAPENISSLEKPDALTLSPAAQKLLDDSESPKESQWEQTRTEKVDRVRELVQTRQYGFTADVVDAVAQRIVALLP